jgi:Xaa-Pro aminopeptidase
VIEHGDVVKIDIFATTAGYLFDTGRSVFVCEIDPGHRTTWQAMEETLLAIYEVAHAGNTTADLWRTFVSSFGAHGMEPAIRFLGHGLGLSLHGEPFIASHTETELEVGMVSRSSPSTRSGASGSTWRTMSS